MIENAPRSLAPGILVAGVVPSAVALIKLYAGTAAAKESPHEQLTGYPLRRVAQTIATLIQVIASVVTLYETLKKK